MRLSYHPRGLLCIVPLCRAVISPVVRRPLGGLFDAALPVQQVDYGRFLCLTIGEWATSQTGVRGLKEREQVLATPIRPGNFDGYRIDLNSDHGVTLRDCRNESPGGSCAARCGECACHASQPHWNDEARSGLGPGRWPGFPCGGSWLPSLSPAVATSATARGIVGALLRRSRGDGSGRALGRRPGALWPLGGHEAGGRCGHDFHPLRFPPAEAAVQGQSISPARQSALDDLAPAATHWRSRYLSR